MWQKGKLVTGQGGRRHAHGGLILFRKARTLFGERARECENVPLWLSVIHDSRDPVYYGLNMSILRAQSGETSFCYVAMVGYPAPLHGIPVQILLITKRNPSPPEECAPTPLKSPKLFWAFLSPGLARLVTLKWPACHGFETRSKGFFPVARPSQSNCPSSWSVKSIRVKFNVRFWGTLSEIASR